MTNPYDDGSRYGDRAGQTSRWMQSYVDPDGRWWAGYRGYGPLRDEEDRDSPDHELMGPFSSRSRAEAAITADIARMSVPC